MCLGIPGRVVEIENDAVMPMGIVDFGGVKRETCLAYVADEVSIGDYVIVHAGFAISKLDEAEAKRTFELLRELGEGDNAGWLKDIANNSLDAQRPAAS
jgi:hydrogenase expression/formation protein HypC